MTPYWKFALPFLPSKFLIISFAEDYDEESATSHVKRLLDIVACTTCFGPSVRDSGGNSEATNESKSVKKSSKQRRNGKDKRSPSPPEGAAATVTAMVVDEDGEMSNSCPKLGSFYEFFSLSHLTPPLQCKLLNFALFLSLYYVRFDFYFFTFQFWVNCVNFNINFKIYIF